MKVIALEGPSYAGKSTAIAHVRARGLGRQAFISDCYVEHLTHGQGIPPSRAASAEEQLRAFQTFMEVERSRVRGALEAALPVAVLDRSVDTLLAHAHAMEAMFGYDVLRQLRRELADQPHLRPDRTLYLDVPAPALRLRRQHSTHRAAESPYFLHDPAFLTHARDYFLGKEAEPVSRDVTVVPAGDRRAVVDAVEAFVNDSVRRPR